MALKSLQIKYMLEKSSVTIKTLSKLAQEILCIPAKSTSCKRNFLAAGYLINECRIRSDPEIIDASLFLNNKL